MCSQINFGHKDVKMQTQVLSSNMLMGDFSSDFKLKVRKPGVTPKLFKYFADHRASGKATYS